jgi:DNA polymerase-3 subunit delta
VAFSKSSKEKYPSSHDFIEGTKNKNYAPVYLFIGQEEFLVDECVRRIIDDLLTDEAQAFNLDIVYGSKVQAGDAMAHASSFPMMSDRRVVVVKEFDKMLSGDGAKELIASYVAHPMESTCLVLLAESPDFRTKPFTDLKKAGTVYSFPLLYDNQIPAWIADRCKRMKLHADLEACRLLQAYIGNSLRALQNELEKLSTYLGERTQVTPEDIADVVGVTRGFTVFDLQNAVGKKDLDEALRIARRMLETGEAPQLTIVMLTRYFSLLWKVQDLLSRRTEEREILAATRISPFYLKNYTDAAAQFSSSHIQHAFAALLDADVRLKSTSPDPNHLMELLVCSLVRGPQQAEEILI